MTISQIPMELQGEKAKSGTATFHLIEAPGFEPCRLIGSQPSPRMGWVDSAIGFEPVRTDHADTASGIGKGKSPLKLNTLPIDYKVKLH